MLASAVRRIQIQILAIIIEWPWAFSLKYSCLLYWFGDWDQLYQSTWSNTANSKYYFSFPSLYHHHAPTLVQAFNPIFEFTQSAVSALTYVLKFSSCWTQTQEALLNGKEVHSAWSQKFPVDESPNEAKSCPSFNSQVRCHFPCEDFSNPAGQQ